MEEFLRVADFIQLGVHKVPFIGKSNVWVEDSIQDNSSISFVRWLIQKAICETHPGELQITVYDESLSGIASPFENLNSGSETLLRVLEEERAFTEYIYKVRSQIHGVNKVIQGQEPNLISFRNRLQRPIEGYNLVVISSDLSLMREEVLNQLAILFKSGPRTGFSFLVHSMSLDVNPFLSAMCDKYRVKGNRVYREGESEKIEIKYPTVDFLIHSCSEIAQQSSFSTPSIKFHEVENTKDYWNFSSKEGLTFSIGIYGTNAAEIKLGDELHQRHNILITGAVGQGKSNLISVILHSLCQRYSPDELELYLLDFKEGVSLQHFYDEESGEYLPHSRVLALESDKTFGLSVFEHLFLIYKERMSLFKEHKVQNIKEYREKYPDQVISRIVVIIDEFQMMFEEKDHISEKIADILAKGVRLFRACGIHIILSSQTIGGNSYLMGSIGEGVFAQVPIRIALKNSVSESYATLGMGNDGAAYIRSRQAILNSDYGEITSNKKVSIAHANNEDLASLRKRWWQSRGDCLSGPYIFLGSKKLHLPENVPMRTGYPKMLFGETIEVGGEVLQAHFTREPGRNVVFLGQKSMYLTLFSSVLSFARSTPGDIKFSFVDFLELQSREYITHRSRLFECISMNSCKVHLIQKSDVEAHIRGVRSEIDDRAGACNGRMIVFLGADKVKPIDGFQDVCKYGPQEGVHVVGLWSKFESFRDHVGYSGDSFFDLRVASPQGMNSVRKLMEDPVLQWEMQDNRILFLDNSTMSECRQLIPFSSF